MVWRGQRRNQLPPDWPRRRQLRLELDGYQCTALVGPHEQPMDRATIDRIRELGQGLEAQRLILASMRCTSRATDVHHAVAPDDHRVEALRSLCHPHHDQHTQAEAQAARGAGAKRARPRPPHPGLKPPTQGGGQPPTPGSR